MDRFDAMRVFTRVVERRSFTLAAEDLALPRSTVTDAVKQLEARLGARLLQRTTRHVSPRPAGGIISAGFDEFRLPLPVRPGDELRVESEILEVRPSKSRPNRGLIKVR